MRGHNLANTLNHSYKSTAAENTTLQHVKQSSLEIGSNGPFYRSSIEDSLHPVAMEDRANGGYQHELTDEESSICNQIPALVCH